MKGKENKIQNSRCWKSENEEVEMPRVEKEWETIFESCSILKKKEIKFTLQGVAKPLHEKYAYEKWAE